MHGKLCPSLPIPTMSTHCLAHCETSMVGAGGASCYYRKVNPQTDRVHTVPGSDCRFYHRPLATPPTLTVATFAHL